MRQVVVNDLVFGSGRMKICVPVCEKTTEAVLDAVKEIKTTPADLIEWRIDYFDEDMFAAAPEILKAAAPLPVLCTFRTKAEGGEKAIDPMDYFAMNAQLSALGAPLRSTLQRRPFRPCTIWVQSLSSRTTIFPKRLHARKSPTAISA